MKFRLLTLSAFLAMAIQSVHAVTWTSAKITSVSLDDVSALNGPVIRFVNTSNPAMNVWLTLRTGQNKEYLALALWAKSMDVPVLIEFEENFEFGYSGRLKRMTIID